MNYSECKHENYQNVPSYYDDVEWCPECGAVRGNNGGFGRSFRWFDWQVPKIVLDKKRLDAR